jgi:hypothetical protein
MTKDATIFNTRKSAPLWWFNKSSDLRASAGILWLEIDSKKSDEAVNWLLGSEFNISAAIWPVYKMLCGMSLELIFKAALVAKRIKVKHTHNLVDLANQANLQYSDKNKEILNLYTESVVWEGKYPTPKCEENLEQFFQAKQNNTPIGGKLSQLAEYEALFDWTSFNQIWSQASEFFWSHYSNQSA